MYQVGIIFIYYVFLLTSEMGVPMYAPLRAQKLIATPILQGSCVT